MASSLPRFLRGSNSVAPSLSNLSFIFRLPRAQSNSVVQIYSVKGQIRSMGSVSAIDSAIFRTLFGTEEIRQVFKDESYIARCVDAETALARAQSKCNVIPSTVGAEVTKMAVASKLDLERLRHETEIVGYPILPLVRQLSDLCGEDAGKYVHWGATTQDIMDVASVLQIKDGLVIVERLLRDVVRTLRELAEKYRDTPMAGRTHLQHALPVTFGYKCAVWLSGFQRHLERLQQLRERALLVQFGGAAGSLASLGSGDDGIRVRRALAEELGLVDPPITWHVARDGIAETVNFLALLGGSMGKVALDIIIMSSNELGEVSEPFVPHRGASSTMPQKRNPISSEVILAASKILRSHAGLVLDGMVSDFERASGPWHLEWVAVPESFVLAVGALSQTHFALSGLAVNSKQMRDNLHSTRGLIVAEAVMMGMAPYVGRQTAHDIVYEACRESIEQGTSLVECLLRKDEVTSKMSRDKLEALCDPVNYLGAAPRMVDDVLAVRDL
ncbi:3-carboxy-cis,cis-muconate cycloisomerase [Talaromyces islandicus]|uniref:3-carboxy-cis,cis-muconate cycloisomerase n=1 Tax=Talaromyces islandicus TaxID=28573 RepID=A0A0U1M3X3_TALIS|nr:3-carboxy-cis,cis-muconate cycloisomerase [Talaromyces islandicus]